MDNEFVVIGSSSEEERIWTEEKIERVELLWNWNRSLGDECLGIIEMERVQLITYGV